MKKFISIMVMLYAMSFCGGIVYADNTAAYSGSNNEAIINDTHEYSTVLIRNVSDGRVVYANQANNVYEESMHFMLKANPDVGLYSVSLGSEDGTTENTSFYIGVNSNNLDDEPMTRLSYTAKTGEDSFTAGFSIVTSCSAFSNYKSLKVCYINNEDDKAYGGFDLHENWNPMEPSGEGDIMLVFVLDHITWKELLTVSVFLSEDPLPSGSGNVD